MRRLKNARHGARDVFASHKKFSRAMPPEASTLTRTRAAAHAASLFFGCADASSGEPEDAILQLESRAHVTIRLLVGGEERLAVSIAKLERVVLDFAVGHARQQVEAARDQASRYHFCLMLRGQPPLPLFTHTDDGRRDVLRALRGDDGPITGLPVCRTASAARRTLVWGQCDLVLVPGSQLVYASPSAPRPPPPAAPCGGRRPAGAPIRGAARRRRERLRRHRRGREGRVARRDRRGVPEPGAARRPAGRGALADGRALRRRAPGTAPRRGHRRGGGARGCSASGRRWSRGAAAGRRSARLRARACGGRGAAGEAPRSSPAPRRCTLRARRRAPAAPPSARGRPRRRRRRRRRARRARARGCSTREAATLCCSRR